MAGFVGLIKLSVFIIAAGLIGNWFVLEVKKAKREDAEWYKPYISPPGIIIILAIIFLPLLGWMLGN